MDKIELSEIEKKLGYAFKNKELLLRAFTHSSYTNENRNAESYERLEFLGDAAIGFAVGLYLYETFPNYPEGQLTKMRAGTVDRETVASVIDELDVIKFVRVGKGDAAHNVVNSVKAKCDLFEAIIGAVIIDNNGNIERASKLALRFLKPKIHCVQDDYKSKFLEYCAKHNLKYEFKHTKRQNSEEVEIFVTEVLINGEIKAVGTGSTKKNAEKAACHNYFSK